MPIDPALPVIAVFGSNRPKGGELHAACLCGVAVHRADAVLLTGGDLKPPTVKDAAIWAADRDPIPDSAATWMGVGNSDHPEVRQVRGPCSVVVTPGWGHRRTLR